MDKTLEDLIAQKDPAVMLGPEWTDERWPVALNARGLPIEDENGALLGVNSWWVPYGEGWEIPAGFEHRVTSRALSVALWIQVVDGQAECVAFKCSSEKPLTATQLRRLSIPGLVEEGVLMASRPWDEIPKRAVRWSSLEEARQAREATSRRARRRSRERSEITDDLLRDVAAIYRAALASGKPTKAVAETLDYSRASAGRLVMAARERGFLPETEPRKARA